jgi:alkylhydroperoxidase family enzyme
MAHTASTASRNAKGREEAKIERLGAFETDPIFSEKERATLAFAAAAAAVPNTVEAFHFARLREFYTDEDIVEIVAVIAMFGFLNRWNDTMATDLEPEPRAVGEAKLKGRGWTPGKHASLTSA